MDTSGAHVLGSGGKRERDSAHDVQRLLDQAYSQGKSDGYKQARAELMLDPSRIRRLYWEAHKHVLFLDSNQYTPIGSGYVRLFLGDPHITEMDSTSALPDSAVLLWEEDYESVQLHDGVQAPVVGGSDSQPRDEAPVEASPEDQVPQYELMLQVDAALDDQAARVAWHAEVVRQHKEQVPGTALEIKLKSEGVHAYKAIRGMVRNTKPVPVDKVWWAPENLNLAEAIEDMIKGLALQGMVPHVEPNFSVELCEAHQYGKNAPGEPAYRVMGTFVNAAELRLWISRQEDTDATSGSADPGIQSPAG